MIIIGVSALGPDVNYITSMMHDYNGRTQYLEGKISELVHTVKCWLSFEAQKRHTGKSHDRECGSFSEDIRQDIRQS